MNITDNRTKIKRDGERDRQTDRQADRPIDRQTDRHRHRHRQTETGREVVLMTVNFCLFFVCFVFCYSTANRPGWAMKSRTALNMNEFTLFDVSFQNQYHQASVISVDNI